jgi:hypothetical protein
MLALAGIPAWLIVAVLTIKRWRNISKRKAVLYNLPALVSAALYVAAYKW